MSLSCWCGFSNSNFVHDCAVCSSVARGITGWPISHIPCDSRIRSTNSILNSGRGLTLEQRQLMLAESQTVDQIYHEPSGQNEGKQNNGPSKNPSVGGSFMGLSLCMEM